jgi:hypothetical protein
MRWIIPIPAVLLTVSVLPGAAIARQRMERIVTAELVDYSVDLYRLVKLDIETLEKAYRS